MSLIAEQHTKEGARLLIWKDEEPLHFFMENTLLSEEDKKRLCQYRVERRKKDLLITRYLLQRVIPQGQIDYHSNGKPYLIGHEAYISISHSQDLVALIIHPQQKVAIDIEYIHPRIAKVKERFLSPKELASASKLELLTLFWSAKESLFKWDDQQGLDFAQDLHLYFENERLYGVIRNNDIIPIHYHLGDEWTMTYIV